MIMKLEVILVFLGLCVSICMATMLTSTEKQQYKDQHNNFRRKVSKGEISGQPPAANMMELVWSDELAQKAENWASTCPLGHDSSTARKIDKFWWVGQNLYGGPQSFESIEQWFGEHANYVFATHSCSGVCGHYTQIAWAITSEFGCAYQYCKGKTPVDYIVICDYGVGGNSGGDPYIKGTACSKCPTGTTCNDGLCKGSTTSTVNSDPFADMRSTSSTPTSTYSTSSSDLSSADKAFLESFFARKKK